MPTPPDRSPAPHRPAAGAAARPVPRRLAAAGALAAAVGAVAAVAALTPVPAAAAPAPAPGGTTLLGSVPLPAGALISGDAGLGQYDDTQAVGLSADGRYVVFVATSDLLVTEGDPERAQVLRKDRVTGAVTLVSRANGPGGAPAEGAPEDPLLSADGNRVAWRTAAQLDPADTDTNADVYVRDVAAGTTTLATPGVTQSIGYEFAFSADGRHVAFSTGAALVAGDQDLREDVYRFDTATAQVALVSQVRGDTRSGNGVSTEPSLSADGEWVAFSSAATDLSPGFVDGNGPNRDVWARNMTTGTQVLISQRAVTANTGGNGGSRRPRIVVTPQATMHVAYESNATDVATDGADSDRTPSVYRRTLQLPYSVLVSRLDGAAGASASAQVALDGISGNGDRVVFHFQRPALDAPQNGGPATLWVRDVPANQTRQLSTPAPHDARQGGAISADGATVAWASDGGVTDDSDPVLAGVFARAYPGGAPELVSRPAAAGPLRAPVVRELGRSGPQSVSADGRFVLVTGTSAALPGFVAGQVSQVYRLDTRTGAYELVSRADGGDGGASPVGASWPTLSADGTRAAFNSRAALAAGGVAGRDQIYVRDLAAGTTTLASRADGPDGAPFDNPSSGVIAPGGGHVLFAARGADDRIHAWVRELASGRTELVDRADGPAGAAGNGNLYDAAISADGSRVVFATLANNVHPDDGDTTADAYLRDRTAGTTTLVGRRDGAAGIKATETIEDVLISADGRVIAFQTRDEDLVPGTGPWNGEEQLVVRDLASAANRLATRAPGDGPAADGGLDLAALSADGSVVAYSSVATNLAPGHGDGKSNASVYVRTLATGEQLVLPRFGTPGVGGSGATLPSLTADGRCVAFVAQGHSGFNGAAGDLSALYGHALREGCFGTPRGDDGSGGDGRSGGDGSAAKPRLTKASLLRKRFQVGPRRTARTAGSPASASAPANRRRGRRPVAAGTAFRFTLDTRATVAFAIERKASGRKVGRACRRPARRLRKKKACVRWVAAGALTRKNLAARKHAVAFSGRIGRKALAPGAYRVRLTARNAAGASKPVTLAFTVARAAARGRRKR